VRRPSEKRKAIIRRGLSSKEKETPDKREIISQIIIIINLSKYMLYKQVNKTKIYKGKEHIYYTAFLTHVILMC
jgi:hypothetical protein